MSGSSSDRSHYADRLEALRQDPSIEGLQDLVRDFYAHHERSYPWRETHDPWLVLVSEVMLQQTQTDRIAKRYPEFVERFPEPRVLADASVEELLTYWKGLGYNRRGLNLKRAAEAIVQRHDGSVPDDYDALLALPGVGPYTASAVLAFAFQKPVVLIETNIRRLFIHVFFSREEKVPDSAVLERISEAVDRDDPRSWYYALMDFGSAMKGWVENPNRKSKHYTKQTRFEGSDRQIRGRILDALLQGPKTIDELFELPFENARIEKQLAALASEGFCERRDSVYRLR